MHMFPPGLNEEDPQKFLLIRVEFELRPELVLLRESRCLFRDQLGLLRTLISVHAEQEVSKRHKQPG